MEKPGLPTTFYSCGASGCAKECPGLAPPAAALCPTSCLLAPPCQSTAASLCPRKLLTGVYKPAWVNFTLITCWISNPLQLQLLSLSGFLCLFFCSFSFNFSLNTPHNPGCYAVFPDSAVCNSPPPRVCAAWLQCGCLADQFAFSTYSMLGNKLKIKLLLPSAN